MNVLPSFSLRPPSSDAWKLINPSGILQAISITTFGKAKAFLKCNNQCAFKKAKIHTSFGTSISSSDFSPILFDDTYIILVHFSAFMCHHNSFLLYESIENTCITKWKKVTHVSISISFIMMVSMALGGYATFTGQVQGTLFTVLFIQNVL